MIISLIFNNTPIIIDICTLPKDRGPSKAGNSKRFYYDTISGQCKEFSWVGYGGNKNRFRSEADCENKCKGNSRIFFIINSCSKN